jgi:hypothetical protein
MEHREIDPLQLTLSNDKKNPKKPKTPPLQKINLGPLQVALGSTSNLRGFLGRPE